MNFAFWAPIITSMFHAIFFHGIQKLFDASILSDLALSMMLGS